MSYIVEQKLKGRIYLYRVDSYWDKEKKQSRQKRVYIGPKNPKRKKAVESKPSNILSKHYGNLLLVDSIAEKLGVKEILKSLFPHHYREILALGYYDICTADPLYLFPHWLEQNHLQGVKKLDSSGISKLCDFVGKDQQSRLKFEQSWLSHVRPTKALYYDITSISSYSNNISFVEWGYNRDHENLAQINMGVVFCSDCSLPVSYHLYPGSIVDVTTLRNCVKHLKINGISDFLLILDRGFFSTENLRNITQKPSQIKVIQPLPFTLKKVKQLVKTHRKKLEDINSHFLFNDQVLSHCKTEIFIQETCLDAHLFFDERTQLNQKHMLIKKLAEIEEKVIKNQSFSSQSEGHHFKHSSIPKSHQEFFKFSRVLGKLIRNQAKINEKIGRAGCFVLATNKKDLKKEEVLSIYRNKDQVEKSFDLLKNEMDGNRLRAHSQENAEARIFIKFIALIIRSEMVRVMRAKKLFSKYTVKEMLAILSNIKQTNINGETMVSEISKTCKTFFDAFEIDANQKHSY